MYQVVEKMTIKGLQEEVVNLIQDGYQPAGGIFRNGAFWYQAMWKMREIGYGEAI